MLRLLCLSVLATSVLSFILPQQELIGYSDDFARNKMLALASAAYSTTPQKCLTNVFQDAQLKRQINAKCDLFKSDTCSGYTAVLHADKAIVMSFRGTDAFLQLITESNESIFESKVSWVAGGKVSKYFYEAFMAVWNGGMKDDLLSLKNTYPNYQIWVSGHSLGGSMASLAASYVVATKISPAYNVLLFTYGQPRTGDKNWQAAHDQQAFTSYRLTHWRDMVPHVPPELVEDYRHHMTEVFYHNDMGVNQSFRVCTSDEDKKCSDGLTFTMSIKDHLHYFNRDVSGWGDSGCK